jgi:dephospho-CoA kinase
VLRVGLTGGIGAGKSTVAGRLRELGAVVVDADVLARRAVEPGSEGLAAVVDAFGPQVLTPDGALDRPTLGRLVFADEAARGRLNAVLHPRIAELTAREVATAPADAVVVHDVPLLVENDLGANYQLVVVVTAPRDERVRRLVVDRGMAPGDALARIAAQAGDDARRAAADVLLDNEGEPGAVLAAVDALWHERLVPFETNVRLGRCPAPPTAPARPAAESSAQRLAGRLRRAVGALGAVVEVSAGAGTAAVSAPPSAMGDVRAALARAGCVPGPRAALCWPDPALPVLVHLHADREE